METQLITISDYILGETMWIGNEHNEKKEKKPLQPPEVCSYDAQAEAKKQMDQRHDVLKGKSKLAGGNVKIGDTFYRE